MTCGFLPWQGWASLNQAAVGPGGEGKGGEEYWSWSQFWVLVLVLEKVT